MVRISPRSRPEQSQVITKAVMRAADRLGLSNKVVGKIVGLSEASVSRMAHSTYTVTPGDKPFELSVLLIRLFRSLDAIVGGDETAARAWLRSENTALGQAPLAAIQSVQGLVNVIAYLDARRAVV